jgi:hypothetical protein
VGTPLLIQPNLERQLVACGILIAMALLKIPKQFVNRLVLITEFSFQTQTSNFDGDERTTGTINPGLLYIADKYQLGVEAIIPINRASGDDVGVIANLHLFLEDIFP